MHIENDLVFNETVGSKAILLVIACSMICTRHIFADVIAHNKAPDVFTPSLLVESSPFVIDTLLWLILVMVVSARILWMLSTIT